MKFVRHNGKDSPIASTQGAIVKLRSGSKALIAPSDEPSGIEEQVLWQTCNDKDDIVAYSVIQPRAGDRVVRAAIDYIEAIEDAEANGLSSHRLTKHVLGLKRQELCDSITNYKNAWPDWPETKGLRRLIKVDSESLLD